MKTKVISLSAISASLIALCLTLGAYFGVVDIFMVIIASFFVILPTYYKSYLGSILAFLAGGVLAFLFSGFNFLSLVFPAYFAFFGLYPIVRCKENQVKFNKFIYYPLCLVWCVSVIFGLYFFLLYLTNDPFAELPKFVVKNIYFFVALVGVLVFIMYDRCIFLLKRLMDNYLGKLIK